MKKLLGGFIIFMCCFGIGLANTEITVSTAASLKEVMYDIKDEYEKKNDVTINVNLGGSGTLKNQIIQGAPVDIVFFASKKDLEDLKSKDLIATNYNKDLLKNHLVIIGKEKINNLDELENKKIAIGNPKTVPAGRYAMEVLKNYNIFDKLEDNLLLTKDVRSAVQYAELGEVDFAFVYETDTKLLKHSNLVYQVPEKLYKNIIYSCGIIKDRDIAENKKFFDFLSSEEAEKIYKKYNFIMLK